MYDWYGLAKINIKKQKIFDATLNTLNIEKNEWI
jgi:hypothetical protein